MNRSTIARGVIALLVCAAVVLPSSPASAVVPGRDGKIAFTRANQVYTINQNGSGVTKLTTSGKNYWPRWSPNGQRIAYVNEVGGVRNIWVMNANGSNKRQVTTGGTKMGAAWSPDGQWLAFGSTAPGPDGSPGWFLARARSTAPFGAPEILLGSECPTGPPVGCEFGVMQVDGTPTWSTTNRIAFEGQFNDSPDFYITYFDVPTGKFAEATASGGACCGDGRLLQPAWSANGQRLGYTRTADNTLNVPKLYIGQPSIGDHYASTVPFNTKPQDEQIAFSPSGTKVALMNDSSGTAKIFIAKPDGTGRKALTNGYQPDWQPLPA